MNPLWNTYEVAGGRWILLVMIDPTVYWPRLCAALERPDLLDDPRFAEPFARAQHAPALIAELEGEFARRTLEDWRPLLDAAGLIWSPVQRIEEVLDDPQARAMGYFRTLEHGTHGPFETLAPPFSIDGVPLGAARPCSDVDADADAILREAGLDDAEIAKLKPVS